MAVGENTFPTLPAVAGFRLGTASAGIKTPGRKDLVVMECAAGSSVVGVFTRNAFCAAPVQIAKTHLAQLHLDASSGAQAANTPCYFVINTGNANAGTGAQGCADAMAVCESVAELAGVEVNKVLPFSTGVIGEPLAVTTITQGLPAAIGKLDNNGWQDAAEGILTTDTQPKGAFRQFDIGGKQVTVTGISKGSGMIKPNMATMLGFVATDADVPQALLQQYLVEALKRSFNRITVDGDTSTNDSLMLVATGQSGVTVDAEGDTESDAAALLRSAIIEVCETLAQAIVRDGEGATKFVTIKVAGGLSSQECLDVAYTVAESPLVKTALFASDPNWGRILAAIGRAGITDLDADKVKVWLGEVLIAEREGRAASYTEAAGQAVMDGEEITIHIDLGRAGSTGGKGVTETIWTTDLSYDYIRINAEYRS
ncbi:MAG: bifunctional glutamate N-acetyltransferase/amino-acid acetyltransferase ArgJ [Porticoccaceae bacterium]